MRFINFEAPATSSDRSGLTRQVAGCSLLGQHKFLMTHKQRLAVIANRQDES